MLRIAILIPTTTNNTKFKKLEDTHLFKYCLNSLLNTLPAEHKYTIYYAIDDDDKLYNKFQTKKKLINTKLYKKISSIKIITTKGIEKGNVVGMWNRLSENAYADGNDYFLQMGDDIVFHHYNWLNVCIEKLKNNNDIGMSSPIDINSKILTQSLVSRKHIEIFGYYFNPKIINWGCDDWINGVYHSEYLYSIHTHTLENIGDPDVPRYKPIDDKKLWKELIAEDKLKLNEYINKNV